MDQRASKFMFVLIYILAEGYTHATVFPPRANPYTIPDSKYMYKVLQF